MRWPRRLRRHRHSDRHWVSGGVWAYFQCKCGARRVRRFNHWLMGPVKAGWPVPVDRHNVPVNDTGWRKPPAGGWPSSEARLPKVDRGPAPGARA